MIKTAATVLALAALALPNVANAAAKARTYKDKDLLRTVTEDDLAQIVRSEGHEVEDLHPYDVPSVHGMTPDGLYFELIGTACDSNAVASCQGILMQVRYDADETVTAEGVNQANLNESAVTSWWDKSLNTVGFNRYIVLDDGVTWGNIRQNLRVLLSVQDAAADYIYH